MPLVSILIFNCARGIGPIKSGVHMIKTTSRAIQPLAIGSIKAYQKFVSPHKGYRCAHAQVHGGLSCSNYALAAIDENGVSRGLVLLIERFKECAAAANKQTGNTVCIPICIPFGCGPNSGVKP
jgi:putative component of membrane protein insertase Oxa1/YidC/SpoIIIJ protein YidD